jgi:predicted dehydrogenase
MLAASGECSMSVSPNTPSRRAFLGRSAVATAAAVSAPYFVPSKVLAAPGRPGANDRIGIGYIGVGRRSLQLMDLPPEGRIVAAADVQLSRAQAIAEKHRGMAYADYRELLESPDVDAVVVATPDHWHALPSIHACQAGKDVYCEKPMTLTIREGRQMVDAARRYNRVVQTGSQQRSMTMNRVACQWIREGRFGKVKEVIASNYPSPWYCDFPAQPTPTGLNWDVWCGQTKPRAFHNDIFIPRSNPGWISFREYSGGEMTGWGAHGFDQIQWALGMDDSGPVEMWSEGVAFSPPTYRTPESRARGEAPGTYPTVVFRYASGVMMRLADGPPGGGRFVCEDATITVDRGMFKIDSPELDRELRRSVDLPVEAGNAHHFDWFAAMKSRRQPIADVEIGHRSATVCHLGNIARETGRRLKWDPQAERFIGDDDANQLVAREQRAPYSTDIV